MKIELFSTEGCGLCETAHQMLERLKKEFLFELSTTVLTDEHPRFREWHMAVPVVIINGKRELKGKIDEADVRRIIREERPPTPLFYIGKVLEAAGFLTLAVGLMYGLGGDMWTDLYFLIIGVAVFTIGRAVEKRELRRSPRQFDRVE